MIDVRNLSLEFGEGDKRNQVLFDVNFSVQPGEIYGLVGESGSGKTTVLKCLAGLFTHWQGELAINGQPLDHRINQQRCRLVQMVFQDPYGSLHPRHTIGDILEEPLQIHGIPDRDRRINSLLDKVGLNRAFRDRYPHQLSGGQQQRVAIARALVNRPKVLLLDEPLGALDLRLRKDMQNELKRIQQQMGITFIYVTHDQEEALTMSDTVVVMDKGRIQQIGTPEDIYNEPKNAFVADFIGESNILNGTMVRDGVVRMYRREFKCVDQGFAPNEPVDVVIRPEDIDIVPVDQGQLVGTVTNVTFKGMQYDIIVDLGGFKWLIQTTDHSPVGAQVGVKIDPDGFHIMKKSEYSGMFGDYSSYSEEYEELADATLADEEESGDEE